MLLRVALLVYALAHLGLLAGCVSSEEKLFETGRDERVYNPQSGRYEWPKN